MFVPVDSRPYSIWIERNDPLGFAEHHTEEVKAKKLDKKFVASLMQQVTKSTITQEESMRWTTEAKLEHIKENANINIPDQYKTTYTDLILKHFKVEALEKQI